MQRFDLIDRYLSEILDIDLAAMKPGECRVVESPRRLRCEQSYGFVHALLGLCFNDGRIAFSTSPGAAASVMEVLAQHKPRFEGVIPGDLLITLRQVIGAARAQRGNSSTRDAYESWLYACRSIPEVPLDGVDCRRLFDASIPPAEGLNLPTHCFPDGIVYGVVKDERVVSVAYAHRSGIMEDQVVDIGVETALSYCRRGFAKVVVGAVTAHMVQRGGEALYACSPRNIGSVATARSVGFELYARRIVVPAQAQDEEAM